MSNPVAITKRNVDSNGNTVAIKIYETRKITGDGFIALKQIPDQLHRVKIVNLLYDIELIINGKDSFIVLSGETVEFDIEKHGIISSIVANVFNDIDNRILVEVGYSSKIV